MRVASLCTGFGGVELGLVLAGVPVELAYVADPDPGAAALLAHRNPHVPNLGDITAVDWAALDPLDMLTAGYPCQPFSLAGQRKGTDDERHLWPAIADAVRMVRPRHLLLENVPGHRSMGFGRVLADLAGLGYVGSWRSVRASDVGAAHKRERVFIHAYPADTEGDARWLFDGDGQPVADAASNGHGNTWASMLAGIPAAMVGGDPVALMPTPTAVDGTRAMIHYPQHYDTLPAAVAQLLPTPTAACATGAGTSGRNGGLNLQTAVASGAWGKFARAIARWEAIIGRPAPDPTEPSRSGGRRLTAAFVEWLMGLPAGWVTDVPGLSRNQMLRLLGNGVVPRQLAYAWSILAPALAAVS